MYLLDTNHCSSIIQGDAAVIRTLREKGSVIVATSVIVWGELMFMAYNSQQKTTNLVRIEEFLSGINIYYLDQETADIYGQFKAEIIEHFGPKEKSKRRRTRIENLGIGENDLWIAAIALRNGLTIVSADSDFQRLAEVRELAVESWFSS